MFLLVLTIFIFSEISLAGDKAVDLKAEVCRKAFTSSPSFEKSMQIVQSEGIKGQKEYKARYKELGLPSDPDRSYKETWQGWGHFLGTGRLKGGKKDFPSFEEAMKRVQSEAIKNVKEYKARHKELGLPYNPHQVYKEAWQGYGHFLGTGRLRGVPKKDFPSFEKAMELVQSAGIKNMKEYSTRHKELDLPSNPHHFYKEAWQG